MGCTFCATGTMGIKGDLSAGEILEQLVHAQRVTPIRNVVFMVSSHCICQRGVSVRELTGSGRSRILHDCTYDSTDSNCGLC